MKKETLILLTAGIVLACLLIKSKKQAGRDVIKLGDKGNDVYGLQSALTAFTGLKFSNMGAYDTGTQDAVRYYLQGTSALVDPENGSVDRNFAKDLYVIQSKINRI